MSIHTCSYYCDRPECIRAQRDELRQKLEQAEMVEKGTKAWADTPDDWVDELRGGAEKPWVKTYAGGKPNYTAPVHASDISQERVDETAKRKHKWVGLTDEEIEDAWIEASDEYDDTISINNLGRILEAKLKEKNT